jgi:hypothetical protein
MDARFVNLHRLAQLWNVEIFPARKLGHCSQVFGSLGVGRLTAEGLC